MPLSVSLFCGIQTGRRTATTVDFCVRCDRDVHVVEVTGSAEETSGSHGVVRVVVRAETRRRRHVVLLLKLGYSATSYIRTEGLRGTLDVVVSQLICRC